MARKNCAGMKVVFSSQPLSPILELSVVLNLRPGMRNRELDRHRVQFPIPCLTSHLVVRPRVGNRLSCSTRGFMDQTPPKTKNQNPKTHHLEPAKCFTFFKLSPSVTREWQSALRFPQGEYQGGGRSL